jgi:hypothetical protein
MAEQAPTFSSIDELRESVDVQGSFLRQNPHQLHPGRFGSEVLGLVNEAYRLGREQGRIEAKVVPLPKHDGQQVFDTEPAELTAVLPIDGLEDKESA